MQGSYPADAYVICFRQCREYKRQCREYTRQRRNMHDIGEDKLDWHELYKIIPSAVPDLLYLCPAFKADMNI